MVLATALCLFGACGDKHVDQELPGSARHVVVEGPWKDGARIPVKYTCDGRNVRPNVGAWAPKGAREEAIVMTDPDAPGGTFVHWTHWGRSTDGRNSFGKTGYSGPCPPKGDKPHHYVITLYLLRAPLGLPAGSPPDKVVAAIRGQSFASGSITGLYGR